MEVQITYIGHSGFLAETDREYLLFDYYEGIIPVMKKEKPLYVFVSHRHGDHFNPVIFTLMEEYPLMTYVLSYDIKIKPWSIDKWKLSETVLEHVRQVRAGEQYEIGDLRVSALKSTDEGVAFFIQAGKAVLYHAGDLNWWHWEEESKQWNTNMAVNYKREIDKLTDMSIDIAFLPLDPRQGNAYWLGFEYILQKTKVSHAFPMHFWKEYSVIGRLREEGHVEKYDTNVVDIKSEGEVWKIHI